MTVFSVEAVEGFCNVGIVLYKPAVVVGQSKELLDATLETGAGHAVTRSVFSGSVAMPAGEIMCPRYATACQHRLHLTG